VPLRLRGLTRTVTFVREAGGLASRHYQLAAFVPFQGVGAHADRKVMLRDGIVIHTDDPGLRIDAAGLSAALDVPRLEHWTGARYDFPDEVSLFTTVNSPCVAQLRAGQQAIDQQIVGRGALYGTPVMITADSIAYRTSRQVSDDPAGFESGVIAHGPQAGQVAGQFASLLRRWARDYCRRGTAQFRYLPGTAPDLISPDAITVVKRHGVLTVTWPEPQTSRQAPAKGDNHDRSSA
jgi:protein-L-isoaspartate(D-aspartate) O-methyltransferase